MGWVFSITAALAGVWWICSGQDAPFYLICGLVSILATLGLLAHFRWLIPKSVPRYYYVRMLLYVPWLIKEVLLASISVLNIIWFRPQAAEPTFGPVPAAGDDAFRQLLYSHSITLTPGTLTIDATPGTLMVHAMTREGITSLPGGVMEEKIRALAPGDTV